MPCHDRRVTAVRTPRLLLRPLTDDDVTDPRILLWHTDPEGYVLMAETPRTEAEAVDALTRWRRQWADEGHGYWIAEQGGEPVGIGGVRAMSYEGTRHLNLYYRLAPEGRGQGFATEIARAATEFAAEHFPQLPVVARVAPTNEPSLRTIRRTAMHELGPFRLPHDPPELRDNLLFQAPAVRFGIGDAYDDVLDLWQRVNAAGGAVGFEGAAPRADVAAALDQHLRSERCTLVRIHAPTYDTFEQPGRVGALLGLGFVQLGTSRVAAHRATLYRVMTDPDLRARGYGRLLMAALHGTARREGAEICEIAYRGGTGLESFYAPLGYVETGRVVGGLRFSWGDVDDVAMARRLSCSRTGR